MLNSIFKGNLVGVRQQNVAHPFAHSIQQQRMLLACEPQLLSFVDDVSGLSQFFPFCPIPMVEPAPEPSSQLHNLSFESLQKLLERVQITESNKHDDKDNLASVEKDKRMKDDKLKPLSLVAKPRNIARKFKLGTTGNEDK